MRYLQKAMDLRLFQQAWKLKSLNETVTENTENIESMQAKLDKHFTVINDIETETHENRERIRIISTSIERFIN
jgi:uncharacterized coiled-coil protein SlyX